MRGREISSRCLQHPRSVLCQARRGLWLRLLVRMRPEQAITVFKAFRSELKATHIPYANIKTALLEDLVALICWVKRVTDDQMVELRVQVAA